MQIKSISCQLYKAYKNLEAYNQVIEGWARNVKINSNENGLTVVKGNVDYVKVQLLLHTTICYVLIKTTGNPLHSP